MIALNLDKETSRILSACKVLPNGVYDGKPIVDKLPNGNLYEYRYVDGEFVHEPLPKVEEESKPTQLDIIEAQVTYTAMMTDTLLEV